MEELEGHKVGCMEESSSRVVCVRYGLKIGYCVKYRKRRARLWYPMDRSVCLMSA